MQMQQINFVEIEMGVKALEAAQQKLDYAEDRDLIDAAIFEFKAAGLRLNYLFRLAKTKEGDYGV
jgi:hypothetical protein